MSYQARYTLVELCPIAFFNTDLDQHMLYLRGEKRKTRERMFLSGPGLPSTYVSY